MSGTRLIPRQPDNAAHSPPSRASMLYRLRRQLVKEGFEAVLSCNQRETPAVSRIFDGEKEAKLIALACSKPPKGRTRWTLRLLENKVVELGIVERASDSTIGRALKKPSQAALVSKAAMILQSLHPALASETSAFNKIRALSRRRRAKRGCWDRSLWTCLQQHVIFSRPTASVYSPPLTLARSVK
jgi:hypothetical protein